MTPDSMETTDTVAEKSIDLSEIDTVFCESLDALSQAIDEGLPTDVLVKTISPAILLSDRCRTENLEERLPLYQYERFFTTGAEVAELFYRTLIDNESLRPYALLLTRIAISHERYFLKGGLLDDADFECPRAVLNFDTGHAVSNERMNSIWSELVSPNARLITRDYKVKPTDERDTSGGRPPKLTDRLRFASWNSLFYRLFEKAGRWFPDSLSRGRIIALSEIEMVKETGCYLGLRGFKLDNLKIARMAGDQAVISADMENALETIVRPMVLARATSITHPRAVDPLLSRCLSEMKTSIARYEEASARWPKLLSPSTRAILTGYPDGPETQSLARYARRSNIPFVAFQHGVDREITGMHDFNHAHLENSVAEYFVTYNDLSTDLTERSVFDGRLDGWKCKVAAAGLSRDQLQVESEHTHTPDQPPVLYVSTAVYRGYFAYRTDANTDVGAATEERDLVRNVLNKTPHQVAFKPYPALRFPDPDPVLAEVRAAENVHLTGEFIDLRYLVRRHRVLVVMRATSTVGWCLMTQKPLVYVDVPHWFALRAEAREAFKGGVFYFDSTDPNWMTELQAFLSQPIEEIEALWRAKASARRELIRKFVDSRGPGAGARAAKQLSNWIAEAKL